MQNQRYSPYYNNKIGQIPDFHSFISEQILANKSITEQDKQRWLQELEIQNFGEDFDEGEEDEEEEGSNIMSLESAPSKSPPQFSELKKLIGEQEMIKSSFSSDSFNQKPRKEEIKKEDDPMKEQTETKKENSEAKKEEEIISTKTSDCKIDFLFKYCGMVVTSKTSIFQLLRKVQDNVNFIRIINRALMAQQLALCFSRLLKSQK